MTNLLKFDELITQLMFLISKIESFFQYINILAFKVKKEKQLKYLLIPCYLLINMINIHEIIQ